MSRYEVDFASSIFLIEANDVEDAINLGAKRLAEALGMNDEGRAILHEMMGVAHELG